jgi:threonine dehydrogenase-like Zn-dependent dehydrogenase
VKRTEANDGTAIRLYEARNTRGNAGVQWYCDLSGAASTNILEEQWEELVCSKQTVEVSFTPYQIITIKIKLGKEEAGMKAIVMQKGGSVRYEEVAKPRLQSGQVLLKVAACGICGTDYARSPRNAQRVVAAGHRRARAFRYDRGVLRGRLRIFAWRSGDDTAAVHCGNCDACRTGRTNLCERIQLIGGELPGGLPNMQPYRRKASSGCRRECRLRTARWRNPPRRPSCGPSARRTRTYRRAIIFGVGAIGLLTLTVLRESVDTIVVTDIDEQRLETALELGASSVIHTEREPVEATALQISSGKKYDLAVDAAGFSSTRKQGFSLLASGGDFLFVALGDPITEVDFTQLVTGELRFFGTQCHTRDDFLQALERIHTGQIDYDRIVTQLPLARGEEAFDHHVLASRST